MVWGVTFDPGGDQLVPRRLCGFTAGRAMGIVRAYYVWYVRTVDGICVQRMARAYYGWFARALYSCRSKQISECCFQSI